MHVYDTYEGNKSEEVIAQRLAAESVETVTVDDDQRRRSRVRIETDAGTEVGIVVGRTLQSGDVLSADSGGESLLAVSLEPTEAVVVDLSAVGDGELVTAVALGHAVGNRHWDLALRDEAVVIPATESDARIDATLDPHLPDGASVRRETVSPALFDGGGPGTSDHGHDGGHTHDHGHNGGHDHGHNGEHDHGHGTGQTHTRGHSHDDGGSSS